MKSLNELRDEIGAWANATFPQHTDESVWAHLAEEVDELSDAVSDPDYWTPEEGETISQLDRAFADLLVLTMTLAYRRKTDLDAAVAFVHAENLSAEWYVDANGVTRKRTPQDGGAA